MADQPTPTPDTPPAKPWFRQKKYWTLIGIGVTALGAYFVDGGSAATDFLRSSLSTIVQIFTGGA